MEDNKHTEPPVIFDFLDSHGIAYTRVDHPPVFTCEEADRLVPALPGAKTKNLFLRDGKGRRYFLLGTTAEKSVDLKSLGSLLGVSGLGLASPSRLAEVLGLTPGAVTLLGVINDQQKKVEVLIDEDLWACDALLCHPLVNTSTLSIEKEGLQRFFDLTGHQARIIAVPVR